MSYSSRRRWRREEFNSNILLGSGHTNNRSEIRTGRNDDNMEKKTNASVAEESIANSHNSHGYTTHYGPISQFRPPYPINHITHWINSDRQMGLIYSDAAGHIFIRGINQEVVNQLLIPTTCLHQPNDATTSPSSMTSSHVLRDVGTTHSRHSTFSPTSGDDSLYECAFCDEMAMNDLQPFRSSEPIIDLKIPMDDYGALPVRAAKDRISVCTLDLIHAHSITRIRYLGAESYDHTGWSVPQVIHMNTILTLPASVTIASCEYFPGVPRGPDIEVGPFILTQHGSSHIYLARPNSTEPPTILVHALDLKPITSTDSVDFPPQLCRGELQWVQKEGHPGHFPLLVMFDGYVFRIGFNPSKLAMTRSKLHLLIGNSPNCPSMTPSPFFRPNAQEYFLQEMNRRIFILDRLEGSVSEFTSTGELKQCIEPPPPPALRFQTPAQGFFVHDPYAVPRNIYLIDSIGSTIFHWTSDYFIQCQYDHDGYPSNSTLTTRRRMKRPLPLRPAILLPSTVLKPARPLTWKTGKGWIPYTPPPTILEELNQLTPRFLFCWVFIPLLLCYLLIHHAEQLEMEAKSRLKFQTQNEDHI